MAYESIWDAIPDNVKRAFSGSRDVLLELKLSSRETSMSLMECQLLPGDTDITEVLPLALVKRIDSYLRRIRGKLPSWLNDNSRSTLLRGGQSASEDFFADVTRNWKRKRPIWVLTLISSLSEENVKTWNEPVLDHFLDNVARSLGKNLTALESTNDHCQPLNRLDDAQASFRHKFRWLEGSHVNLRLQLLLASHQPLSYSVLCLLCIDNTLKACIELQHNLYNYYYSCRVQGKV